MFCFMLLCDLVLFFEFVDGVSVGNGGFVVLFVGMLVFCGESLKPEIKCGLNGNLVD